MKHDLDQLTAMLLRLPADERLIIAAELFRRGKVEIAETIAQSAVDMMTAKRLGLRVPAHLAETEGWK